MEDNVLVQSNLKLFISPKSQNRVKNYQRNKIQTMKGIQQVMIGRM